MKEPQNFENRRIQQTQSTPNMPDVACAAAKNAPEGKMCGRTFGVQSLRKRASCEPCQRLAGPEVLLSLLPRIDGWIIPISPMMDPPDLVLRTGSRPFDAGAPAIRGSEAVQMGPPWPPE